MELILNQSLLSHIKNHDFYLNFKLNTIIEQFDDDYLKKKWMWTIKNVSNTKKTNDIMKFTYTTYKRDSLKIIFLCIRINEMLVKSYCLMSYI